MQAAFQTIDSDLAVYLCAQGYHSLEPQIPKREPFFRFLHQPRALNIGRGEELRRRKHISLRIPLSGALRAHRQLPRNTESFLSPTTPPLTHP